MIILENMILKQICNPLILADLIKDLIVVK